MGIVIHAKVAANKSAVVLPRLLHFLFHLEIHRVRNSLSALLFGGNCLLLVHCTFGAVRGPNGAAASGAVGGTFRPRSEQLLALLLEGAPPLLEPLKLGLDFQQLSVAMIGADGARVAGSLPIRCRLHKFENGEGEPGAATGIDQEK